jgi:hypothetical protein
MFVRGRISELPYCREVDSRLAKTPRWDDSSVGRRDEVEAPNLPPRSCNSPALPLKHEADMNFLNPVAHASLQQNAAVIYSRTVKPYRALVNTTPS